jgi:hypothetical protein
MAEDIWAPQATKGSGIMLLNYLRENKGKSLLVAGIVFMWLLLLGLFKYEGYTRTWELWGVQTQENVFMDFRLIPGSAESFRHGFEPSIENPFEPGHRIFNYPAFWRLFFYTNITQDDTIWIGILMLILYFVGIVLFPQKPSVPSAFWMLLIIFSPASMLLYERGNVDLIVFFICVLIILAAENSAYWAGGLILCGAVVKMFPLFGVTLLLRESKRTFFLLVTACLVFMLVYGFLTFGSQNAAWNTTMRGVEASYGTFVLISRFHSYFQSYLPIPFIQWMILFEVLALFLIILAAIPAVRNAQPLQVLHERNLAAFRMGTSIYVGTFLLGNNWDYRLAFLVLVIPQLSQWFYLENKSHRNIAVGVMVAVILSCWHFVFLIDLPIIPFEAQIDRIIAFDESINWLLLPGFAYLLAASFPDWLRHDLQKVFGANERKFT